MSITIREGGFYVDRSGLRVGPIKKTGSEIYPFQDEDGLIRYTATGGYSEDGPTNFDLVSEWIDHEARAVKLAGDVRLLRAALMEVAERPLSDGSPCFCIEFHNESHDHDSYCIEARAALAATEGGEG